MQERRTVQAAPLANSRDKLPVECRLRVLLSIPARLGGERAQPLLEQLRRELVEEVHVARGDALVPAARPSAGDHDEPLGEARRELHGPPQEREPVEELVAHLSVPGTREHRAALLAKPRHGLSGCLDAFRRLPCWRGGAVASGEPTSETRGRACRTWQQGSRSLDRRHCSGRGGLVQPIRPDERLEKPPATVFVGRVQRRRKEHDVLLERVGDDEVPVPCCDVLEVKRPLLGSTKLVREDGVHGPSQNRALDLCARVDSYDCARVVDRVEVVSAPVQVERILPAARPDRDGIVFERHV